MDLSRRGARPAPLDLTFTKKYLKRQAPPAENDDEEEEEGDEGPESPDSPDSPGTSLVSSPSTDGGSEAGGPPSEAEEEEKGPGSPGNAPSGLPAPQGTATAPFQLVDPSSTITSTISTTSTLTSTNLAAIPSLSRESSVLSFITSVTASAQSQTATVSSSSSTATVPPGATRLPDTVQDAQNVGAAESDKPKSKQQPLSNAAEGVLITFVVLGKYMKS